MSFLTLGVRILGRSCTFPQLRCGGQHENASSFWQQSFVGITRSLLTFALLLVASAASASEIDLVLPDLSTAEFFGMEGNSFLMLGLLICVGGMIFGLKIYKELENMPVHRSMREISELIYETCKTYLITQGKFILILEVFIGAIMVVYFGFLEHNPASQVLIILLFSLVGIAGSYGVAWFGIRVNTFANSRTAFAALAGKPFPLLRHPA